MIKIQNSFELNSENFKLVENFKNKKIEIINTQNLLFLILQNYMNKNKIEDVLKLEIFQNIIRNLAKKCNFYENYNKIPLEFAKEAFEELKNQKDFEFDKKFRSILVEFKAFNFFQNHNFSYLPRKKRENGDADLLMQKENKIYNIEVKVKENDDIFMHRLQMSLNGLSFLPKYAFLRGLKIDIILKCKNLNEILSQIFEFAESKKEYFNGKFIEISKKSNAYIINDELENLDYAKNKIEKLFCGNGRILDILSQKSKKFENFIGYLYWTLPFDIEPNEQNLQSAFKQIAKKLKLDFDLYICIFHPLNKEINFEIKRITK